MFANTANGPDCWKCSLHVEWHDCSWCPSIRFRRGLETRRGAPIKPLPAPSILPHPVRRNNLATPMKNIGNRKLETGKFRAFTLVELLVVIAIIGILAAMLLPVLTKAKVAAQKTKAKTEMADIVNAVNAYDTDYGRFPLIKPEQTLASTGDFTVGLIFGPGNGTPYNNSTGLSFTSNSNVVANLMDLEKYPNGNITSNNAHVYNPKQVKYLGAKMSGYTPVLNDPNALGGVDNTGIYRDPWGNPYVITMNTSYDEKGTSDLLYSLRSVSQDPPGGSSQSGYNGLFNPDYATKQDNFLFHGKVMVWSAGPDKTYDTGPANTGKNKDNILSW